MANTTAMSRPKGKPMDSSVMIISFPGVHLAHIVLFISIAWRLIKKEARDVPPIIL